LLLVNAVVGSFDGSVPRRAWLPYLLGWFVAKAHKRPISAFWDIATDKSLVAGNLTGGQFETRLPLNLAGDGS